MTEPELCDLRWPAGETDPGVYSAPCTVNPTWRWHVCALPDGHDPGHQCACGCEEPQIVATPLPMEAS